MVYNCLKGDVPIYLKEAVENRSRVWESKIKCIDEINNTICKNKTFANKAFSVAGLRLWNSLPHNIRNIKDLSELKKSHKTCLFTHIYCNNDN